MKNCSVLSALLCLFLGWSPVIGQTNNEMSVKGVALKAEDNTALGFASVSLLSLPDSQVVSGTLTKEDGAFFLQGKKGLFVVKVTSLGFEPYWSKSFQLSANNPIDLGSFSLASATTTLDAVEIQARKSQVEFKLDKKVFNVGQDLSNNGGSASDILDNIPSVAVDLEGNVSLRGSQGVRILVNGKPSGLTGISNADALSQLPANMIDKVEIITNPSARYEAEGNAGIINIVLKKDQRKGWNGNFNFSAGHPANYNTAINLNHRREKFNFFGSLGFRYRNSPRIGFSTLDLINNDTTTSLDTYTNGNRGGFSGNIRMGFDYEISQFHTFSASALYRLQDGFNTSLIEYFDYDYLRQLSLITTRETEEQEDEYNLDYQFEYKRTFPQKGRSWTTAFTYSSGAEEEFMTAENLFFDPEYQLLGIAEVSQQIDNGELEQEYVLNSDYIQPFNEEGKFEAGYRGSLRVIDTRYRVDEWDAENSEWVKLPEVSNEFLYEEIIHAAYAILGDQISRFDYQLGLRTEFSQIDTELMETGESNSRQFFNFFPSLHLGYEISPGSNLQWSYSRRVRRPRFWDLNPFFTFSNPLAIRTGNPDLNPQFTNSLELSYLKYWDKASASASVYYRKTNGVITRITTVDEAGISYTRPENLAEEHAYGLELTYSQDLLPWWKLNASTNLFRGTIDAGNLFPELRQDFYSLTARLNSQMDLNKSLQLQIMANYRGPRQTAQGSRKSMLYTDIGLSQDLLKNRATFTLRVSDLFNTRKYRSEAFGDNFYRYSEFQRAPRRVFATFSYRLNQKKKPNRQRRGGGDDDMEF
ncbi:MAG: outer membrane beta-barrel family protein [Bacteroidota bacterium]